MQRAHLKRAFGDCTDVPRQGDNHACFRRLRGKVLSDFGRFFVRIGNDHVQRAVCPLRRRECCRYIIRGDDGPCGNVARIEISFDTVLDVVVDRLPRRQGRFR